jgi:gliding motility-associated-like protein
VLHIGNYGGARLTDTVSQVFEVKEVSVPQFSKQACANNLASVTISDTSYDTYLVDFGDGTSQVKTQSKATVQHTYLQAGTYSVKVTGSYKGSVCSATATQEVTLLPPYKAPYLQSITVVKQGVSGEIQFDIKELQPGYIYIIERWQDPRINFQKIDTIRNITQNSISYLLKGINTSEAVWYLVRVADKCNSIKSSSNSNIASSIALDAKSGNEQVILNWQSMPGAQQYEVYRNNARIATLSNNIATYNDSGLNCGQNYSYHIKGIYADGSTSISASQNVQVNSSATPAAPFLVASFNLKNHIELSINIPQGKTAQKFEIQRSINGASYGPLATVQKSEFTDNLSSLTPVCYRATFTDPCNNTSEVSNVSCPIILKVQRDKDNSVKLNWTNYIGFAGGGLKYTVELLDANGNVVNSYNAPGNTYTDQVLSNDLQVLHYRIKATTGSGKDVTYSNLEKIEQDLQLFIPSAFTPNGDGLNDVLEIKGTFIDTYTIKIYNSIGSVVFESTNPTINWDGTYHGKMLPVGAYAYEINVKTSFGATKRRTGTVTLLR